MKRTIAKTFYSILLITLVFATQAQTSDFEKAILDSHNQWREDVDIDPLKWSPELASQASDWAKTLKESGCYLQNSTSPYGENLFIGTSGKYDWADIVDSWGLEIDNYDIDANECASGSECGHYKQIVWERTTEVGCGTIECGGNTILVCFYNPRGNYQGVRPYSVEGK